MLLVILKQLPVPSFLAQLAAQMSSVSANTRKIISIASVHQRLWHCCRYLLEFVLRPLMPDSQGADVCKTAWPMSLLKCQLLTKLLSPILLSPYAISSLRILVNSSFSLLPLPPLIFLSISLFCFGWDTKCRLDDIFTNFTQSGPFSPLLVHCL